MQRNFSRCQDVVLHGASCQDVVRYFKVAAKRSSVRISKIENMNNATLEDDMPPSEYSEPQRYDNEELPFTDWVPPARHPEDDSF